MGNLRNSDLYSWDENFDIVVYPLVMWTAFRKFYPLNTACVPAAGLKVARNGSHPLPT